MEYIHCITNFFNNEEPIQDQKEKSTKSDKDDVPDPWAGFIDLSHHPYKASGMVNYVDMSLVEWNQLNSHKFYRPGISALRMELKPPTTYLEEWKTLNETVSAALMSVFCEKGIVQLVLDFLKWYGSTLTLRHCVKSVNDMEPSPCFIDASLKAKEDNREFSVSLANKFSPQSPYFVKQQLFIPEEMLLHSSELRIKISLHAESVGSYWLQSIKLSQATEQEAIDLPLSFNDLCDTPRNM